MLLQIDDRDPPERVFGSLAARARGRKPRTGTDLEVVSDGLEDSTLTSGEVAFDQVDGIVWQRRRRAPWASENSPYIDIQHELCLYLRRGLLVAVLAPDTVRRTVQKWLDKPPRPPIRRVQPGVFNACVLSGADAKNMWLTNVRGRSTSRPDSKALSGVSLLSALDPIGDGSFVLGSARVDIPDDDSRTTLRGTVGTTPRHARLWSGPTGDVSEFLTAVAEALDLIQKAIDADADVANPYPLLATQVDGFAGVYGGFEFRCPPSSDLAGTDVSEERLEAAQALERATLEAEAVPNSTDIVLAVGYDGAMAGRLRVSVREDGARIRVAVGHEGPDTDPVAVPDIRDKIRELGEFSIHYASGHAVIGDAVYQQRQDTAAFTGWRFLDFTGFRVDREKPAGRNAEEIHRAIGENGDDSLFAWVARTCCEGTLLCDDGPGEIADFLHIADDGVLSLIHVKAAGSSSPRRRRTLRGGCQPSGEEPSEPEHPVPSGAAGAIGDPGTGCLESGGASHRTPGHPGLAGLS